MRLVVMLFFSILYSEMHQNLKIWEFLSAILIFPNDQGVRLQNSAWVKYPFWAQDKLTDFNMRLGKVSWYGFKFHITTQPIENDPLSRSGVEFNINIHNYLKRLYYSPPFSSYLYEAKFLHVLQQNYVLQQTECRSRHQNLAQN